MKTIIAIDPGQSGGIVYTVVGMLATVVEKMPSTISDIKDAIYMQYSIEEKEEVVVYLEDVHSMPGQGVSSSFKFGRGFGNLEAIAICLGYRLIYVRPQVWQKALGLLTKKGESKTQHKNRMKAFAQQRYPHVKVTLATADALCILEYAKMMEK